MNQPFDSDVMDEADDLAPTAGGPGERAPFDEGDAGEGFTDEMEASDLADLGDGFESSDAFAESGDEFADAGDDTELWNAFEEEVADGLDAADEDEFLGRLIGGLGRAAGVVGRGLGGASRIAGRVGQVARGAGRAAGGIGRAAQAVSPAAQAAARLARMLGAPGAAGAFGQIGRVAQGVGRAAGQAQGLAGHLGQAAGGAQGLFGQLSRLLSQGGNEFDAFDAVADLYIEDGIDEALPAAVGLAARAAARGLGFGNVSQLAQAGRRALVRGVASAARELISRRGPRALRALPQLAQSAARVAQRRQPGAPQRAAQTVRRGLPQAARRVAQNPRVMRRLAQPTGRPQPVGRPRGLGRGVPGPNELGRRSYNFSGPVTLTITPR